MSEILLSFIIRERVLTLGGLPGTCLDNALTLRRMGATYMRLIVHEYGGGVHEWVWSRPTKGARR